MSALTEAQLASNLSDALATLHNLESFKTKNQVDVSIVWRDGDVSNTSSAMLAMGKAVTTIITDNLQDLFETAVARQRAKVGEARTALLDLQFAANKTSPYVADTAVKSGIDKVDDVDVAEAVANAAHELTQDEPEPDPAPNGRGADFESF